MNHEFLSKILKELSKEMPFKWRVQSFSKNKPSATCVAYIDARDVMERLDQVCIYGWERLHNELKGHLFCGVSIVMPDGSKLIRWDCGVESNTEAEKGEASDSFKRAAVNWGVGRFLYDLDILYVDSNQPKTKSDVFPFVVNSEGKQVYDITKFCNDKLKNKSGNNTPPPPVPPKKDDKPEMMTEEQKQLIIKHASLVNIFDADKRKSILEWIAKPQTKANAQLVIEKNEKLIIEAPKTTAA